MIERTYNVPLRKGFINKARHAKTKKAVSVLKEFLQRHMKSDDIKIGKNLNKFLWQHGIKNPPHHVKIHVIKDDDGVVKAELLGFTYEHLNKEQKEKLSEEKSVKKKESVSKEEKKTKVDSKNSSKNSDALADATSDVNDLAEEITDNISEKKTETKTSKPRKKVAKKTE